MTYFFRRFNDSLYFDIYIDYDRIFNTYFKKFLQTILNVDELISYGFSVRFLLKYYFV